MAIFDLEDQDNLGSFLKMESMVTRGQIGWRGNIIKPDGSTAVGSPRFSENYDDGYLLGKVAIYRLNEDEFLET